MPELNELKIDSKLDKAILEKNTLEKDEIKKDETLTQETDFKTSNFSMNSKFIGIALISLLVFCLIFGKKIMNLIQKGVSDAK